MNPVGSLLRQIPFRSFLMMVERTTNSINFPWRNISIQYLLNVDVVRGYLHKSLSATVSIVESEFGGFKISGRICTQCLVSDPLVGELTVEASAVPVYSIDIHLLRVESIMVGENIATETSIVQTTQAPNIFFLT
ncbi:putative vacuolar protein sorting protein 26 related protein [Helianthus annuus]|nr:putative vacuolar protein sorting protein 26 related protein [Helianthus annuus]